jgi:hypothetical protein
MATTSQRIEVSIQMHPESIPANLQLIAGAGVNVYRDGLYFPGRVLECSPPLKPGDRGWAIIDILSDSEYPLDLEAQTEFELRDGPINKVASAKVVRLLEPPDR